ncbi:MAG TPA: hypothetical protein VFF69_12995 [Phycisphaerales bacterium]|nr:hypothetical protein [Phycisphaerales bacterium]
MPSLTPGASWDGTTSWQGRAIPAAAAGLQGSGWPHKAIGTFNRAPHMWWTADFNLVVGAEHGDDDWIEEVTFWLEGSTVTVDTVTKDTETGGIGFVVTIQPPSGTDGDAEVTKYLFNSDDNRRLRVLGGVKEGLTYKLISQDNTAKTTTVEGDLTGVVNPDTARVSTTFHADSFQTARPWSRSKALTGWSSPIVPLSRCRATARGRRSRATASGWTTACSR